MAKKYTVTATMAMDDESVIDLRGKLIPGSPGTRYKRNGDPGDPPEPDEIEDVEAFSNGQKIELEEKDMERAIQILMEEGESD